MNKRTDYINWDDCFMTMANFIALRSKDPSTQVGSCIVKNNKVVGMGYNGFPNGISDDSKDFSWDRTSDNALNTKYPYVVHSELNAILNSHDRAQLHGATLYCTLPPCNECAKAIIQSGITKIIYEGEWSTDDYHVAAQKLLNATGIQMKKYKERKKD